MDRQTIVLNICKQHQTSLKHVLNKNKVQLMEGLEFKHESNRNTKTGYIMWRANTDLNLGLSAV